MNLNIAFDDLQRAINHHNETEGLGLTYHPGIDGAAWTFDNYLLTARAVTGSTTTIEPCIFGQWRSTDAEGAWYWLHQRLCADGLDFPKPTDDSRSLVRHGILKARAEVPSDAEAESKWKAEVRSQNPHADDEVDVRWAQICDEKEAAQLELDRLRTNALEATDEHLIAFLKAVSGVDEMAETPSQEHGFDGSQRLGRTSARSAMPDKSTVEVLDGEITLILDGYDFRGVHYTREVIGTLVKYTVHNRDIPLGSFGLLDDGRGGYKLNEHSLVDPDTHPKPNGIWQEIDRKVITRHQRLRGQEQAQDAAKELSLSERLRNLRLPSKQEWFDERLRRFVVEHFPALQLRTRKIGAALRHELRDGDALIVEIETLPVNEDILEVRTALEGTSDTHFATRFWIWVHEVHQIPLPPKPPGFSSEAELHDALQWVREEVVSRWQRDGLVEEAHDLGLLTAGRGFPLIGAEDTTAPLSEDELDARRGGRPRNAQYDWAYEQVEELGRELAEVYPEWLERIGDDADNLADPLDSLKQAIRYRRKKARKRE